MIYTPVIKHSNGISPCLIGNTSSIRVHFPASYVRLPECNWFLGPTFHDVSWRQDADVPTKAEALPMR